MKGSMVVLGAVAGAWALGAVAMAADVTAGTWKLNAAKSRYRPAAQAKYETVTIEAAGDNMKVTLDGTDSAGKKVHAEWTGKYDGKDYPVTGSADIESLAYKKVNDRTYQVTGKRGGKAVTSTRIAYSADGKTRTVTSRGTNSKGQRTTATAVYDKQ
jgi:hypothetical protein